MKQPLVKKALPHILAVLIFLLAAVIFCKPVLEGKVLNQHDIVGWKGMAQDALQYKEKNGHFPLWNPTLFSGMPNYQVAMEGKSVLPDFNTIFSLGLPKPMNYFFLAAVCFYVLCVVLGANPWIGVAGSLAYAFSTYNPIIIGAGHETKMLAIAYMPFLLAGLLLIYHRKYWLGLALTTLGTMLELSSNHPQISYYFFLAAAAVTVGYLVVWIKNRDWKHIGIAFSITAIAAVAGVSICTLSILTSSEYAKATMRGGKSVEIKGDTVTAVKTAGLDPDYAFRYSMKPAEPLVMLMPGAFGESSGKPVGAGSNVAKKLISAGVPEGPAEQVSEQLPAYWGGMSGPGESTSGPPYVGAIIFLLALIGFVVVKHPLRWGLLAASIIAVVLAWGQFFYGFNHFLLENLPLYNKFRAPSMALVITELTLPLMAVLALQQLFFTTTPEELRKKLKPILYTLGGLTALLAILYLMMDYSAPIDQQLLENKWDNSGTDVVGRAVVSGLKADRSSMFGGQVLRTIGFMILVLGACWLYMKKILKPVFIVATLGVATMIDLFVIDGRYLNDEISYVPADELQSANFTPTAIDNQILQDKDPNFRVYNMRGDRWFEAQTSYFHKSIGGYHPAKLRLYQDIIERYLSQSTNPEILNMLNAKYVIAQNPQNGQQMLMPNPQAYGHAWLVKNVKTVKDEVEALQAIGSTQLKDTAIVIADQAAAIPQPSWDSLSSIRLTKYDNDEIEYAVEANGPQFAVFSEIYYPYGWNAYIDGQKTAVVRTDYLLRGVPLPAGKHTVKLVFEPESYKKGVKISYIGSWLILLLVIGGVFLHFWQQRKQKTTA
ncbi:YfhO family protein [Terrimonas ferruginea]|uniref:YfhO family protein n=1 Tax=Terrimonas ferruginea TaxID=249 RepID=UPI000428BA1B|nr:YfhO family protein [Terrimonas ferruginea]